MDGKAFRPDGKTASTLIPPAYGLAGVNLATYTGWGSVPYWNAFVGNLEMHGSGAFFDPRLNNKDQFPVAARSGFANVRQSDDGITSRLAALQFYQLAIPAPAATAGSFDERAADHGRALFNSSARCSTCHVPPLFTEPGWALHRRKKSGSTTFKPTDRPNISTHDTVARRVGTPEAAIDGRFPTLGGGQHPTGSSI